MPMENGLIYANNGSGISTPAIARTGGAQFDAFNCSPFPKWVAGPAGDNVLVQSAAEEADVAARVEKALKAK